MTYHIYIISCNIVFYCNEDLIYPGMRCANKHLRIGPSISNTIPCTQVEIQTSFFAALDSGSWILDWYSGFLCDSETLLSPEPGDRKHGALGPTYLVRDFTAFHTFSRTNPHLGSKVQSLCFCMCCLYTLYIPVKA